MTKRKVEYKNKELDRLVGNEEDRDLIVHCIILFPSDWQTIKEMLLSGLEPKNIKDICIICYEYNLKIQMGWRFAKHR